MDWRIWLSRGTERRASAARRAKQLQGALAEAVRCGSEEGMRKSVAAGADVNQADEWTRATPLMLAAGLGQAPAVSFLLEQGADCAAVECIGQDALMWAAKGGCAQCVRALLGKSDPSRSDREGRTALMLALWHGNREAAGILAGASDLSAVCANGRTAMDYAFEGRGSGCAAELLLAGWPETVQALQERARGAGRWDILAQLESLEMDGNPMVGQGRQAGARKGI